MGIRHWQATPSHCKVLVSLGIRLTVGLLEPFLQRSVLTVSLTVGSVMGHMGTPMFLAKLAVLTGARLLWNLLVL